MVGDEIRSVIREELARLGGQGRGLVSIAEAARRCDYDVKTVQRLVKRHKLKRYGKGSGLRVDFDDVLRALAAEAEVQSTDADIERRAAEAVARRGKKT